MQISRTPGPESSPLADALTQPSQLPNYTSTSTVKALRTPATTPHPTTATLVSQPASTVTPDAQATLTQQTQDSYATQIASLPIICEEFFGDHDTLLSPNGTWLAIHCGYSPPGQTLEVVRQDGTRWVLQFSDYVHPGLRLGDELGMGGLYPQQWTADEKYLFFSSYIGFDGGGTCYYGFGDHGLFRLNITTGAVSVVLPITDSPVGYLYAFSPGGRRLAYVADPPVILDLRTGELTPFYVGQEIIGNLTWSPDGRELAYAACRPTADWLIERSMVRIYSLETGLSRTILELEKIFISIRSWDGDQQLEISLEDWEARDHSYLYYDWASATLITPTPTPTPTE
jgi:hypothetical protein